MQRVVILLPRLPKKPSFHFKPSNLTYLRFSTKVVAKRPEPWPRKFSSTRTFQPQATIRLLKINPGCPFHTHLDCKLDPVFLDDSCTYSALSCPWGGHQNLDKKHSATAQLSLCAGTFTPRCEPCDRSGRRGRSG